MAHGLPSDFLAYIRLGVCRGRALELRLAKWTAQRVSHAFVLDDDVGFATIDTLAAYRIGNHNDLTFPSGQPRIGSALLHFEYGRIHNSREQH